MFGTVNLDLSDLEHKIAAVLLVSVGEMKRDSKIVIGDRLGVLQSNRI